jgi:hypothetical protein
MCLSQSDSISRSVSQSFIQSVSHSIPDSPPPSRSTSTLALHSPPSFAQTSPEPFQSLSRALFGPRPASARSISSITVARTSRSVSRRDLPIFALPWGRSWAGKGSADWRRRGGKDRELILRQYPPAPLNDLPALLSTHLCSYHIFFLVRPIILESINFYLQLYIVIWFSISTSTFLSFSLCLYLVSHLCHPCACAHAYACAAVSPLLPQLHSASVYLKLQTVAQ